MLVAVNYSGYGINLSEEGREYIAKYKAMDADDVTYEYINTLPRHDPALTSCINDLGNKAIDNDPDLGIDNIILEEIDERKFSYNIGDSVIYSTGVGCEGIDVKLNEDYIQECMKKGDMDALLSVLKEADVIGPSLNNTPQQNLSQKDKYEVLYGPEHTIKREIVAFNPQTNQMEAEVITFHRVRALKDFGDVKKGQLGGLVQTPDNLSQEGDCWIGDNAFVCGSARVVDSALVNGNSLVTEHALIGGNAVFTDQAKASGHCHIHGYAKIEEHATIDGKADISDAEVNGYAHIGGTAEINDDIMITGHTEINGPVKLDFEEPGQREAAKQKAHEAMGTGMGSGFGFTQEQTQEQGMHQQMVMAAS